MGGVEQSVFKLGAGETAEDFAAGLVGFLREFRWVHRERFVEFFTGGCYDAIPGDWKPWLTGATEGDLRLLTAGKIASATCPASLRRYVDLCSKYTMDRTHLPERGADVKTWKTCDNILKRGLTPKKQHEVERMAHTIEQTCSQSARASGTPVQAVVDVGCGQGYLPTFLTHNYGRRVVAIEAASGNVDKAVSRGAVIEKAMANKRKRKRPDSPDPACADPSAAGHVSYVRAFVSPDSDEDTLDALLASCGLSDAQRKNLCLVGLHACGDLTPLLLRLYARSARFDSLAVVGCCYYKMGWPAPPSFPLSQFARSADLTPSPDQGLIGPVAAQLACETSHRWVTMGAGEWEEKQKASFHRALLEIVLQRHFSSAERAYAVRSVSRAVRQMSFEDYARCSLAKLKPRKAQFTDGLSPPDAGGFSRASPSAGDAGVAPVVPLPDLGEFHREHAAQAPRLLAWLTLRECISPPARDALRPRQGPLPQGTAAERHHPGVPRVRTGGVPPERRYRRREGTGLFALLAVAGGIGSPYYKIYSAHACRPLGTGGGVGR
ncbi:hypothetical protein DIPPA_29879 [Diplonema papillatum]|nr:hypothetical protein DIPPA_29879 [Diplonema papillatum]